MVICPKCGERFHPPLRSTGKFSQNHAVHGFASQIEKWLDDGDTTKRDIIDEAMSRAGFVEKVNRFGRRTFKPEPLWTRDEATAVIKKLKEIARDMEIRLVEVSE